jgi:hypothetical protein
MIGRISSWLIGHIDVVLVIPVFVGLVCFLLARTGLIEQRLRLSTYVSTSLSLAMGYVLALSGPSSLVAIAYVAPQTLVLTAMAAGALYGQWRSSSYKAPSLLWVVAVAILGHCWTRLCIYALSGGA